MEIINNSLAAMFWAVPILIWLMLFIFVIVGYWKIFEKAGKPGWASIIPIYNVYCAFDIAWGSGWYFLLMLIPVVNVIIGIITCLKTAQAFGKSGWFGIGLVFLPTIFAMILGWGSAVYCGPAKSRR